MAGARVRVGARTQTHSLQTGDYLVSHNYCLMIQVFLILFFRRLFGKMHAVDSKIALTEDITLA